MALADLIETLSTRVLENIARLDDSGILRGQPVPGRLSRRRRFPPVKFYGQEPLVGGLPGHRHPRPELATVLDGSLNLVIDQAVYHARRGDWLVFAPNVPHGECCLATRQSYRLLWFVRGEAYLGMHMTRYSRSRGYEVLASARLEPAPAEIRAGLERLCTRPWRPLADSRRLLLGLTAWCVDRLTAAQRQPLARPHPLVAEVQAILRTATGRPPSVTELANAVGLSPNYLSSLFHQETGQTIRHFVEARRMELARAQLADPHRRIKEIAYGLGFADPPHFSHAFRRAVGVSPTAFRRHLLQEPDT